MPRFLTPEWAEAFDAALSGAASVVPDPQSPTSLRAQSGPYTVVQEVRDGPDGDVRLTVSVDGDRIGIAVASLQDTADEGDVTLAITYQDAAALAQGQLSPAEALTTGRVRVRGDLSLLIASQARLDAARDTLGDLAAQTTY